MPDNNDVHLKRHTLKERFGTELLVAVLATGAAFAWFALRLSPGIAFGPWQGPFLSSDPLYRLPLLSQGLAWVSDRIDIANPAVQLNFLSAAFGAVTCGAVAAATTRAARTFAGKAEAGAAGLVAAACLASTPSLTYAATGTTPTTLSACLASLSLLALVLWLDDESSFAHVLVSAVFAGLAAANHPALGLLLFVLVGATLVLPRNEYSLLGLVALGAMFVLSAGIPLAYSLLHGETLRQFLSHALLTPYPNPADGAPDFGFGERLIKDIAPLVLLLALPGVLGLFRPGLRRYAALAAAVFLILGPFLPALTNQDTGPEVLHDPDTPRVVVLAVVSMLAGIGALTAVRLISSSQRARPRRLALLLMLTIFVVALQNHAAPDRRERVASDLADQILAACPSGALLVSGDPSLTSIVTASQHAYGLRRDVDVIPAELLTRPRHRARIQASLDSRVKLSGDFPSEEAVSRWASDRPQVLEQLIKKGGDLRMSPEALDLALWDLVMDNPQRWPICFIGLPSGWLTARAQLCGPVICYPRRMDASAQGFLDLMKRLYADDAYRHDPGIAAALESILIPASELLGRQRSGADARQLVELAEQMGVRPDRVRLALSRTAARQGNREEAARYASEYLADTDATRLEQDTLTRTLDSDLRSAELRSQFQKLIDLERQGKPDTPLREQLTGQLWEEDDIGTLAEGYRALTLARPDDPDALYQYAAALTQLGELPEAQRLLARAAMVNPSDIGQRLQANMARFTLLRIYHSNHPDDEES